MRKIIGEIKVEVVENHMQDLGHLKTVLDYENEAIVKSDKYSQNDIEEHGFDQVVKWVEEDAAELREYNSGNWFFANLRATANIATSMDGKKWMPNQIVATGDTYKTSIGESLPDPTEVYLDLFETLRLLGFTKQQFINALPKTYQPKFRNTLVRVRNDGGRNMLAH
ncbi:hypothetical protein D1872_81200 [compost metagenome]